MPSRAELIAGLRKADAAGDTYAAKRFATMLNAQSAAHPPTPATPAAAPEQGLLGDIGGSALAALHGYADSATLGAGDYLSAGVATAGQAAGHALGLDQLGVTAAPQDYSRNLSDIRGDAAERANNHPVAAIAGDVAGLFGGGGVIGAGLKGAKALPVVGRAATLAEAALAARRGQPVLNTVRAVATGAGVGAVDSALHGGNADQNLISAAGGAIAGPVMGKLAGAVATRLAPASERALALLSDKIGETPAMLRTVFDKFRAATGRAPTMAEVVGMKSRGELATIAAENPTVGVAANQAAVNANATRPTTLPGQVTAAAGRAPETLGGLETARNTAMDTAMRPIGPKQVPLDSTTVDLLSDPRMRPVVTDPKMRMRIADAITNHGGGSPAALSIDDIDAIRQALRARQGALHAGGRSQNAMGLGEMADNLISATDAHVPEYRAALNEYANTSDYIAAFEHGFAGKSIGEADGGLVKTLGTAKGQSGHASGVMSRLAQDAGGSERGANSVALDLTQPGTLRAVMEAVGPKRAAELAEAGAFERKSREALNEVAPGQITPQSPSANVADAAHGLAAVTYHSPAASAYHGSRIWQRIFGDSVKVPPAVQRQVAAYMLDPRKTAQGIALLKKAGAKADDIRRFQTAVSAATADEIARAAQ